MVAAVLRMILLWTISILLASASTGSTEDGRIDWCNKTIEVFDHVMSPLVTLDNLLKPMYCVYKFKLAVHKNDWIISIRFYRFKVGRLVNSSSCSQGYIQIVDGSTSTSISNHQNPGFFCGEIDHPQVYISETSAVSVIFSVERFTEETYFAFDSRAEQQFELYARYGSNPQLYPDRRGKLIQGTFCDRVFDDCRIGTCYVQSPGFPGVYPRNLHCRYFLRTSSLYIRPFIENEEVTINGRQCADMIVCPVRAITTNCPSDYLRVHDGPTEDSPVIGIFCGSGRFPFAVTGTGRELLVVFVSSSAGPFLNTGFHFNVGPNPMWVGHGASKKNGTCSHVFRSEDDLDAEKRRFYSLATWYTPDTTCDFLIVGRRNEIVRLYFKSFRVHRPKHAIVQPPRDCAESLAVYDSEQPDEARVVAIFCDTWAAPVHETKDFVSTGPVMLVQFKSVTGSYAGSSLTFWGQFDFYETRSNNGELIPDTLCDEKFSSLSNTKGSFTSPLNPLVLRHKQPLQCSYTFDATPSLFERVLLTINDVTFGFNSHPCKNCLLDPVDKILIHETIGNATHSLCVCNASFTSLRMRSTRKAVSYMSSGPRLELEMRFEGGVPEPDPQQVTNYIFQGSYQFLHGPPCGPAIHFSQNQGHLIFPYPAEEPPDALEGVHCLWTIHVTPQRDVYLRLEDFQLYDDCDTDNIKVRIPHDLTNYGDDIVMTVCGRDVLHELPLLNSTDMMSNAFVIELEASVALEARFRLVWTEVTQRKQESNFFLHLGSDYGCPFQCPGSEVCISGDLVCNGVNNCPQTSPQVGGLHDESSQLCSATFVFDWLAVGLAMGGVVLLALCVLCSIRRYFSRKRRISIPR